MKGVEVVSVARRDARFLVLPILKYPVAWCAPKHALHFCRDRPIRKRRQAFVCNIQSDNVTTLRV